MALKYINTLNYEFDINIAKNGCAWLVNRGIKALI